MTHTLPRVRVLFDEETIARRVGQLAEQIAAQLSPDVLALAILKSSFVFAADLLRALHRAGASPQIGFIHLARTERGEIEIVRDHDGDVAGRDVLLIDAVLEEGRQLSFATDLIAARGARRVSTAVLLEKRRRRAVQVTPAFVGFACPDRFVVGYGMDAGQRFGDLPFVGIVAPGEDGPDLFDGVRVP